MAEEQKSWWQTAAGLMTGVAALITAATGLLVALHQIRKDSDGSKPAAEQSTSTHPAASEGSSKAFGSAEKSAQTRTPAATVGIKVAQKGKSPKLGEAQPAGRAAYAVPLPATHEFVLGSGPQTARFILTSAQLEPHTTESDILKIGVQVTADGAKPFPFYEAQFELRIDEQPYKSTTTFSEMVPTGQSRDHALHFTIPHGPTRAVLWIRQMFVNEPSNAEISFDLTTPE